MSENILPFKPYSNLEHGKSFPQGNHVVRVENRWMAKLDDGSEIELPERVGKALYVGFHAVNRLITLKRSKLVVSEKNLQTYSNVVSDIDCRKFVRYVLGWDVEYSPSTEIKNKKASNIYPCILKKQIKIPSLRDLKGKMDSIQMKDGELIAFAQSPLTDKEVEDDPRPRHVGLVFRSPKNNYYFIQKIGYAGPFQIYNFKSEEDWRNFVGLEYKDNGYGQYFNFYNFQEMKGCKDLGKW
jgi:hypothetical protein